MRINLGLAVLALLLSTALWVLVVNDQNPDRIDTPDMAIPVEVTKVPPGLVLMNNLDPVRFKIRAPKDRWTALRASGFRATVDLSRLGPGIQTVSVLPESSDPQIHVMEVIPSTVSVRLEELHERTVPVKVNLVGNVPFGYVYGAPKVDPEVVVVSGPASLVQSTETASVDVRLEGITVEIDTAFHPTPLDSTGAPVRSVRLAPQTVKVRLPVEQQVSYKQVAVRAMVGGTVVPGYWIESIGVEPSSVTVVGNPKVLAGIDYVDTATLSVNGASTPLTQDVQIVTPQGVSLAQQQQVRVRVSISALRTSQAVRVAPRVANLDVSLRAIGIPAFIDLTLEGPAPAMQGLRVDSLGVVLDVAGLGQGNHSVKPSVSVPPGVTVASVNPESVDLILLPPPTETPTPVATGTPTSTPQSATPTPPGGR